MEGSDKAPSILPCSSPCQRYVPHLTSSSGNRRGKKLPLATTWHFTLQWVSSFRHKDSTPVGMHDMIHLRGVERRHLDVNTTLQTASAPWIYAAPSNVSMELSRCVLVARPPTELLANCPSSCWCGLLVWLVYGITSPLHDVSIAGERVGSGYSVRLPRRLPPC